MVNKGMEEIEEIKNSKQWNDFLLSQPTQTGIFLQSWEWGEFQQAVGRKVYHYKNGDALAQVIESPLPLGKKYWHIPRGVLCDSLIDKARCAGVWFIRFEPLNKLVCSGAVRTKSVSPAQTLILDLTQDKDKLLKGMHEKTRYNIRLADRKGVRCQGSGIRHFREFWKMLSATSKRDKFKSHPRSYYKKMLEMLRGGEMYVRLHVAQHKGVPIACAIVGYFGDTATYLHGASSYKHRALMGPYALHWDIIDDAKKDGYMFYDFWGVDEEKWSGITRFKKGFSGKVVNYPGTFDLPLNKFWYQIYKIGRKVL